ncbi:hypothetical protein [Priestia endophytica]|uniref:hypothetical protein n=1 Tax=Priestia endophytica TaxID=135735 RepID=UPI0020425F53|nr:hypothetical protein [Priestia endophytica]MCM3540638.1 hypothetical protein [Priestia endophytica]
MMTKLKKKKVVLGTLISTGGAALAVAAYKKKRKASFKVRPDTDMRNSKKIDQVESVDADKARDEEGLTQYDSVLKSDWVANGFPQTHMELEELESQKK